MKQQKNIKIWDWDYAAAESFKTLLLNFSYEKYNFNGLIILGFTVVYTHKIIFKKKKTVTLKIKFLLVENKQKDYRS